MLEYAAIPTQARTVAVVLATNSVIYEQTYAILGASMNAECNADQATKAEDSNTLRTDPQRADSATALGQGAYHPAKSSIADPWSATTVSTGAAFQVWRSWTLRSA